MTGVGLMRRTNFPLALSIVGAVLALGTPSSPALAQPPAGGPRIVRMGPPTSEDVDAARKFVAIMYHGETDDDTADWLSERLLDRYRRAFDLFDPVDDDTVHAAIAETLKGLPARVHRIVDPRVPVLRLAAIRTFAMRWRGGEMPKLLAFARTPVGKSYFELNPVLDRDDLFLRPVLVPLLRDNSELANAVISELTARLGPKFSADPKYAKAIIEAASEF
ncbi:MAG TPA: hypothetical protein VH331_16110 [Allosphingosinicella sp.]|jgi:hypothetical protein|nr:hypothetical protein [Allosphingosinicella sp.]